MTSSSIRTVAVLAGGISHEREVSLRSGRQLADGLLDQGWKVDVREPDSTLLEFLTVTKPEVVWPALHGASGEDGALRSLLQLSGVPYVGAEPESARLAWDKAAAKTVLARQGGSTPNSVTLSKETFRELGAGGVLAAVASAFPLPLVVKPTRGGSAQGVTIVREAEDLPRAMVDAYTYGDEALIEHFVDGVEIAVGIVDFGDGPVALPAVEIEPLSGTYGFEARYNAGETRFFTPARISAEASSRASELALLAHKALGLRHLSRVDIIVDANDQPWFLEVNVLPGLTETSLLPQALAAAGHDLGITYAALADLAIRDHS